LNDRPLRWTAQKTESKKCDHIVFPHGFVFDISGVTQAIKDDASSLASLPYLVIFGIVTKRIRSRPGGLDVNSLKEQSENCAMCHT